MLRHFNKLPTTSRTHACLIRHLYKRLSSSLVFNNQEAEFANRKAIIADSHKQFYPPLNQVRQTEGKLLRVPEFRKQFETFNWPENKRIEDLHVVEGKIDSIRKSGKGIIFIDLVQDFQKVQLVVMNKLTGLSKDEFASTHDFFKKGDFVSAIGYPGVTNVGELSLKCVKPINLASPTLHPLPPKLSESKKRHHNRVVDYLVNSRSQEIIIARSLIISSLRSFLSSKGFLEVSTPIVATSTKGANAAPFSTSSKFLKDNSTNNLVDLQLRVAPELWLKKLIIGGFDKVFEIGSSFRNEGIDGTHNPEFTTCEFYQSFIGLEDLMKITEDIFSEIYKNLKDVKVAKAQVDKLSSLRFQRIEFIPTLEKVTGSRFPDTITVESLSQYYKSINLEPPKIASIPQLLDKLSSTYLEPLCQEPTFIYHQPAIMSPLAKSVQIDYDNRTYEISRRFELFINESEYVNAYEEENSPFDQEAKFKLQQQLKDEFNDEESIVPDHKYLKTMEWGMPPTGGWGLGIDRLCMLLVGEKRIEEVLTFGTLPDVVRQ